ncbi:MAG: GYD domain-containing protein [Actinomycetes bacterium]
MAKYMIKGSYSQQGIKGVIKEGGTERVKAISSMVETLGGSLESMYFSFGSDDVYVISELPDNATAAAIAAAVGAAGALSSYETVVLLSASEVDAAVQIAANYRAPGA